MIISDDSPLRRLPDSLDRKQALFFDGIRFSVQMADLAYLRLRETALRLTGNDDGPIADGQLIVSAFLDAWSIIDSVYRLRGLISQTPGIKQNVPPLQLFMRRTTDVEDLRHAIQHLNSELHKKGDEAWPVWGTLNWFTIMDQESFKGGICFLVAGTVKRGEIAMDKVGKFIPMGKSSDHPVVNINLMTSGYVISLTELLECVENIISPLERELTEQFDDLPHSASDLIIRMDVGA